MCWLRIKWWGIYENLRNRQKFKGWNPTFAKGYSVVRCKWRYICKVWHCKIRFGLYPYGKKACIIGNKKAEQILHIQVKLALLYLDYLLHTDFSQRCVPKASCLFNFRGQKACVFFEKAAEIWNIAETKQTGNLLYTALFCN